MNSMMQRNRSLFTLTYQDSDSDGVFTEVTTCRGTEGLAELYPNLTSKRVQIVKYLNYVKLEPFEGGCVFTRVHMIDMGGRMPSMNKSKGATEARLAQPEALINFVLNGYNL